MPRAKPRRPGAIRSIFILTVIYQVRPWFTPSRRFAAITHAQLGPQASMNGTGTPMSQPATRMLLRVYRAVIAPPTALVIALVNPNTTTKAPIASALCCDDKEISGFSCAWQVERVLLPQPMALG